MHMDGEKFVKKAYKAILQGDFEGAIDWFEKAVSLEPENAVYYYKLSITCARSNRVFKALEYAEAAVRLAPDKPSYRLHLNRLRARERMEQAGAAIKGGNDQAYLAVSLLKEAVMLDPLSADAQVMLGVAYAALEEYPDALKAVKDALRLNPHHAGAAALADEYKKKVSVMFSGNNTM